jgi:O-acetyl-ADP-ribose deacetylase
VIRVVQRDLTDHAAEAVLRPVTAEWTAATPAMRRLELAAGDAPLSQCRQLGELPVGSAVITSAGALPAQFMVHVIVRSIAEPVTASGVRRGLQNGMRRVSEWGIRHVAMPPLGTGAGNLDADEAASVIVPLLTDIVRADGGPDLVEICVDSDYERDVFARHVAAAGWSG